MRVVVVGGKYNGEYETLDVLKKTGIRIETYTADYTKERAMGGFVPSPKLDNVPVFQGYASPSLDSGALRYDTWDLVYKMR